jgi:glycosyltransferase involved in cell wall biosynthesis
MSAVLTRISHIWYFHESVRLFGYDKVIYLYKFFINYWLNTIIFISRTQKEEWERLINIPVNNSRIIYNPIKKIKPCGKRYRNDKLVYGYLGSFTKIKNLSLLIEAFYIVKQEYPNITLLLGGSGDIEEENLIKKVIRKYSLEPIIEISGQISDASDFYSDVDVLVLPSKQETMPLVVLEAMSVQKAVIVTSNTAGLCELFEDKKDCIFFDPSNISELVNSMKAVVDKDYRVLLASNGFKKVCQYNFNAVFEKGIKILFE